jgi:hypothetical protein
MPSTALPERPAAQTAAPSGGLPEPESSVRALFLEAVYRQAADSGVSGLEAPANLLAQVAGLAPSGEPLTPGAGSGANRQAPPPDRRSRHAPRPAPGQGAAPGAAAAQAVPLAGLDLLEGALARLEAAQPDDQPRRAFEAALEQGSVTPSPVQTDSPPPASPDVPTSGASVQNTFNVTVHMEGGPDTGNEELAERLNRLLIEQARRYGIDV